jgi:type VI secretion system protein ImpK
MGLATFTLAVVLYVGFTFLLSSISEVAFAELFALQPRGQILVPRAPLPPMPVAAAPVPVAAPVAPATPPLVARLRQFLAPEIKEGLVIVLQDAQAITVRLVNRNMFGSGEATLAAMYPGLLARIGDALNDEPGDIQVNGYTDNQPIRTARFPSNFELSQSRADAVAAHVRARLKDPKRLKAQGKADSDPLAPNTTPEGRQTNRRTDIVIVPASNAM